jgi:hypothetical protein
VKYLELYKREQTEILYNQDDPSLGGRNGEHPIRVKLPTVESFFGKPWEEAIKEIDGYGLHPKNQKYDFYREKGYYELPAKLQALTSTILGKSKSKDGEKKTLYPEDYFDELESNPVFYANEIEYIKIQLKREYQGYWCFINGTPTYIDGWHYTYLNFNKIGNEGRKDRLPFFRDVDRRIFLFFKWAYTTTESTFKYKLTYNKDGKVGERYFNNKNGAILHAKREGLLPIQYHISEDGYEVDMGRRTVFGVTFPKRRRIGATFMGAHVCKSIAINNSMGTMAIQALTEETAVDDVYKGKILAPWTSYPFFFKPSHNQMNSTGSHLEFVPRKNISLGVDIEPHGGWVRPRSSVNKAFDGNKLFSYLNDESGKKKNADIGGEFRDTIKNTLAQGQSIHGFAIYASTFGEFESGGGREYFEFCRQSYSHKRNDNGFTASGLVTLFIPAYDGLDGYVDEFGYSVIDDPAEPYINMEGVEKDRGAKSVLQAERAFLEEIQDWVGLNTEKRNNPFTIAEAGQRGSVTKLYDINILNDRISYLTYIDNTRVKEVNLEWTNGFGSDVRMVDPPLGEKGKFRVSLRLEDSMANRREYDEVNKTWKPETAVVSKFVLGCDPFSFNAQDTTGKKKSNGGGAMYYRFDGTVDNERSEAEKLTGVFVLTYNNRVDTTDEYCEDMLMAAIYYGCLVSTERNVAHVITKFREWGYEGYLLYNIDPLTGLRDKVAGFRTDKALLEKIFSKYADYVKNYARRENHVEILEEIRDTDSFEEMTNHDLFAAGGMALLGAESGYIDMRSGEDEGDIGVFLDMYD